MPHKNETTLKAMIEERASDPAFADRDLIIDGEHCWSFGEYRNQCVRMANFLHHHTHAVSPFLRGHVAVMMENCKEYLALLGGSAYAGLTFFAINPLLRGNALAETLNNSRATLLITEKEFSGVVDSVMPYLQHISNDGLYILGDIDEVNSDRHLLTNVSQTPENNDLVETISIHPEDPLVVIYTSGTTGVPKGVLVSQGRLCRGAEITSSVIPISHDDVSYLCMPLCHSNALMSNFMPMLYLGGSVVLRRRFSVSNFIGDILKHAITYWTYVGEPVHYILNHIEERFDRDERRIRQELTEHPRNKLRFCLGNGASSVALERFVRWFGLDHMYEAYGQSEAVIMAFRLPDTPRGSVGELFDPQVKILSEEGSECPLAELDANGVLLNRREAVGQLCREGTDSTQFQGYFDNPEATASKCRDGIYYSGDLAHIAMKNGRKFLYFDGRTDDWIRKDGENFSAEPIGHLLSEHPDVERAVVFGVPNVVASDLVMAVLTLREGKDFDPRAFFAWCRQRQEEGALGEKWFPDFVRIVPGFEHTASNKIQVHWLKKQKLDPQALPGSVVYWQTRGDVLFRRFTTADYAELRRLYAAQERQHLLDQ